jgi:hypothetical protein
MRFSLIVFCLFIVSLSAVSQDKAFTIARLQYDGGGDWYGNPTSLPNLLEQLRERLNMNTTLEEVKVKPSSTDLYQYPIAYMNGHGTVKFSAADVQILSEYLERGGLLWADDNYGMDQSFREEIAKVFPDDPLRPVPFNHPIFSIYYKFDNGLPKIHEHDGIPPVLYGKFHKGRIVVLYTYNTDIGDGMESEGVHPQDSSKTREEAMKMAINIILFAMSN